MSSRPYKPQRGGRGNNFTSVGRNYPGNSSNRGRPEMQTSSENFDRRSQGGDYSRGAHRGRRNVVDHDLISSENAQWDYMSQVGLVKSEFVKRKGYLSEKLGREIELMTNHFSFQFPPNVRIYHYHFSWLYCGKDTEEPKKKKLNVSECYKLFDAVMAQYPQYFKSTSVGYDGSENVYLPYELKEELADLIVSDVKLEGKLSNFSATFKLAKTIDLSSIKEYYAGSETDDTKRESLQAAIQALHIILKFPARYNMIPLGRLAMFPINGERYYLSDWIELALGHKKSLRFSEIGLTLVVDRAAAAFLKSGDALDFMKSLIDLQGTTLSNFKPGPEHIKALKLGFRLIKISTNHLKFPKKYVVRTIAERAASIDTFKLIENGNEREVTVADYFLEKHKQVLKYPNLPCIVTSCRSKIPIEMCKIVGNQPSRRPLNAKEKTAMIELTATCPDERFTCLLKTHAQIRDQINETREDDGEVKIEGFKLDINGKPIGLKGIVLNSPRLLYHGKEITPKDGAWNLQGKSFFRNKTFDKFGVLNFCASNDKGMPFCKAFIDKASEMKMTTTPNQIPYIFSINMKIEKNLPNAITEGLKKMKQESCAFALCFFPEGPVNKSIYNLTKKIGDTDVHFPTQGVSLKNVQVRSVQTIANILAKVNKKLGGINVILKENIKPTLLTKNIMIIGADVTHPGEGDELHSSVAASVSTYDSNHTMFYPAVRVQPKKDGKDGKDGRKRIVEVIKDFKSMIQKHLKNYKDKNGFFPDFILYLRDGVSDGQYKQILNEEVEHLKFPYGITNKYKPKVTAAIISKRILTRSRPIYPKDGVGKNLNVPPGTTIDTVITHPSDFDYFQYGHKGIKGTSRPCHYYMVHDDNNLTIDEMAKISYYLCHIFERTTSSTSAPAPVMHAHNLAFKVRQWICSTDSKRDLTGLRGEERFKEEERIASELNSRFSNINVDYARSSMFFI